MSQYLNTVNAKQYFLVYDIMFQLLPTFVPSFSIGRKLHWEPMAPTSKLYVHLPELVQF